MQTKTAVRSAETESRDVPAALLAIALVSLALGIGFRFYHLDRKVYWGDEVYSSLRMFGDTEAELVARANTVTDAGALRAVLHPTPSGGAADPLAPARVLAVEEPHHAPVYYEIAHVWVGVFGNSIAATRSLSAWLSLLALPCAFWLGIELFRSRRAAWTAVALFALSPVVVLYSQQAREYALWTAALLALQAALLRALRLDTPGTWTLFACLAAFALYVFPLTALPLGGLALYAVATQWRDRKKLLRCALAFAAGCAAFVPWLVFLFRDLHAVTDSLATTFHTSITRIEVVRAFLGALRLNFLDLNWVTSSRTAAAATAAALLLVAIAIVDVVRRQPPRVRLFVVLMLLATTLPLLIPDLIDRGQRVREQRYLMPAFIALDYCVVGWLAAMFEPPARAARAAWGYALLCGLLAAGTLSCAVSSQAETWWSTQEDNSIDVARQVNRSAQPLLVGDGYLLYPLVLSNYLAPNVGTVLRPRCYECRNAALPALDEAALQGRRFTTLYALGPSPALRGTLDAFAARHPGIAYECINVRKNCASDLNIEPVFPVPARAIGART